MVIVGSGPSIDLVDPDEGDIFTLGGAHDHLISKGIIPHGWINADPLPLVAGYVSAPHPDVTYYIASHSHPFVFDALRENRVVLWHNNCGAGTERIIAETQNHLSGTVRMMVSGGPTGATRAPFLGDALGYRKFIFYGVDGSGGYGAKHIRTAANAERVVMDGRPFDVPRGFIQQAMALEAMICGFPEWSIEIRGDGFMAAVWRACLDRTDTGECPQERAEGVA